MVAAPSNDFGRPPEADVHLLRWTLPLSRVGMGPFLATWGLDKLFAVEGLQFLASIVIMAVSVVLVLNADDETGTLGRRRSQRSASTGAGTGTVLPDEISPSPMERCGPMM